jgi:N-formylglutamate amidohydrolase
VAAGVNRTYVVDGGAAATSYVAPTTDGNHTVVVTDTDATGKSVSSNLAFTMKTSIAAPTVTLTTDSGLSATDKITNNAAVTVSTASSGVTRTYAVDGGAASSSYSAPSTSGTHTVVVTDVDAAGNTVSSNLAFTLVPGLNAPSIVLTLDSGANTTDRITNNAAVTVSAPVNGVTRTYAVDGGAATSSYVAPAADGSHTVVVTDTDTAGNTVSSNLAFTLKTAIAPPTVVLTTDSGTSPTDKVTNNAAVSVSAATSGVTRTYAVDGGAAAGAYSAPGTPGSHTVVVTTPMRRAIRQAAALRLLWCRV